MIAKSPDCLKMTGVITFALEMEKLAAFMSQQPLSYVGISITYDFEKPPIKVGDENYVSDLRSINPRLLVLAVCEPDTVSRPDNVYVIDLQSQEVLPAIQSILSMAVTFVGFNPATPVLRLSAQGELSM